MIPRSNSGDQEYLKGNKSMKKLTALLLAAIMLVSVLAIGTSATGEITFSDDFTGGFSARNWLISNSEFTWDKENKNILGYGDAIVLETHYGKGEKWWDKFYAEMDFQIRGDDNMHPSTTDSPHTVSMWYRDLMENGENGGESGAIYMFTIEVETCKVLLHKYYDFSYKDEHDITQKGIVDADIAVGQLEEKIEMGEDAPWYNFGIRVTEGKIECYFNQKLVLTSSVSDGTEKIGPVSVDSVDETVGTQKSAVLFFNGGGHLGPEYYPLGATNYLAFDNFEVWTPDYDFVETPEVVYGDVNSDGNINLSDVSKILQAIAKWEITDYNELAADVNSDSTVNLSDVTVMLRHIADWVEIKLGPTA